ncbi:hypothetical protein V2J09_006437 [Rumex salicifolius]
MALGTPKHSRILHYCYNSFLCITSCHFIASHQSIENSIKTAVANKSYQLIPNLLTYFKGSYDNPNPFSYLSTFPLNYRNQVIDEILQSFTHLRPRSQAKVAYDCLLSFTLQSSNSFPIAFAVLQRALRSGCTPVPQIHLLLSSAWLECRFQENQPASCILLEMKSVGYRLDCGTCNYLISSLCSVDNLEEALEVLHGMTQANCVPDAESFSSIIAAMSMLRQTTKAAKLLKEMFVKHRLSPKQGILVKFFSSLCANKEIWKAVDMIEFLEKEGIDVGFESFELVVEGCLECREFVLAAKFVTRMTEKGFIPFINVRQKVVDGLISVGEWHLACAVRHRFSALNS